MVGLFYHQFNFFFELLVILRVSFPNAVIKLLIFPSFFGFLKCLWKIVESTWIEIKVLA